MRGTPKSRPSIIKLVDTPIAGDTDSVTLTSVKSNSDLLTVTSSSSINRKRSPKPTGNFIIHSV